MAEMSKSEIAVYESDMRDLLSKEEFQNYVAVREKKKGCAEELAKIKHDVDQIEDLGAAILVLIFSRFSSLSDEYNIHVWEERRWILLVRDRKKVEHARPYVLRDLKFKLEDAKRLLLDRDEYGRFMNSVDVVALYYGEPEQVPANTRDEFDYYRREVQHRLKKEQERKLAKKDWSKFCQRFFYALTKAQKALRQSKADFELVLRQMETIRPGYSELIQQYSLLEWLDFEFATVAKDLIDDLIGDELNLKVPPEVLPYVTYKAQWWNLPVTKEVEYLMVGTVPCLVFGFDRYIVADIAVMVREGNYLKNFYGCRYNFSLNPCPLGFIMTEPELYEESVASFTIPLTLLAGITRGDVEPPDTRIVSRSPGYNTTYEIVEFDDDVTISDGFLKYLTACCQGETLSQGLAGKGLIDGITAEIIERNTRLQLAARPSSKLGAAVTDMTSIYIQEDLLRALEGLGLSTKEAKVAISAVDIPREASLEEAVRLVLRYLGSKSISRK